MLKDELKKMVAEFCRIGTEEQEITDETTLLGDLNFDSIVFITLILEIESRFSVSLEDDSLLFDKDTTFGQLYDHIKNYIKSE